MLAKPTGDNSLLTYDRALQMGLGSSISSHTEHRCAVKRFLDSTGDWAFVKHNMNL